MVAVYQTVSTKPESATKDVYSLGTQNTIGVPYEDASYDSSYGVSSRGDTRAWVDSGERDHFRQSGGRNRRRGRWRNRHREESGDRSDAGRNNGRNGQLQGSFSAGGSAGGEGGKGGF